MILERHDRIPSFSTRADLERLCRQRARAELWKEFDDPIAGRVASCVVLAGPSLVVDITDVSVSRWLLTAGFWEAWETLPLARVLQPEHRCLDVGANVGYYTALFAERAHRGQVITIEPNPRLARMIEVSCAMNQWSHVIRHALAVSDHEGRAELITRDAELGAGSIVVGHDFGDRRYEVSVTTLDALLGTARLDVMKVDVEGSELQVWAGSAALRAANPEMLIVFELAGGRGYDVGEQIARFRDEGYELFYATPAGEVRPIPARLPYYDDQVGKTGVVVMLWMTRASRRWVR